MESDATKALIEAMPWPAILIDRAERLTCSNAAARDLLGEQIDGRHFATILRQPGMTSAIESSLEDHRQRKARHLSNNGVQDTAYDVAMTFSAGLGAGRAGALLVTFEDVSERENASQMRRDFVANVSHELRTPLTALIGFIETLRGAAKDDAKARERFLTIMEQEASRMNRLVGDLLSLNRVESSERQRPKDRLDLVAILQTVQKTLAPIAQSRSVLVTLTAPKAPLEILGDTDQLIQVFLNLVENAIKYGGSNVKIDVDILQRDPALRQSAVRICVSDNGPGIDAKHLPRLTERFYRADSHRSREQGGTGLGLAIVKHIVSRHRGRMKIDSTVGEGSQFSVFLPL